MSYTEASSTAREETRQQGYATFPCSMYTAISSSPDYAGGRAFFTAPHWHSAIEILQFEEGDFTLMAGTDSYEIHNKCYVILEGETLHSIHAEGAFRESALLFSPKLLTSGTMDAGETGLIAPLLSGRLHLPRMILETDAAFAAFDTTYRQLYGLFLNANDRREDQYNLSGAADQLRARALMLLLIAGLADAGLLQADSGIADPKAESFKRVFSYIDAHYREHIYLAELAALMNLNEQYFSRFFKRTIGKTPVEYVNEIRIKHAARLLKETNDSVLEIAGATGFGNLGHFTNVFKKTTGMKPLEYRSQARGK